MESFTYYMLCYQVLGCMAKLLAQQHEISGASCGSLSSNAFVLMVIHYLQQVKPPVVPVLQEVCTIS